MKIPKKYKYLCPGSIRLQVPNKSVPVSTNIFVPGYLGIMVTRQQQFCCIFAATKDKSGSFLKKLFHSSTLHPCHHDNKTGKELSVIQFH